MEILIKKVHFLVFLIIFMNFSFSRTISQESQSKQIYCGNIKIEDPFVSQNSKNSSFLKDLVLCRSNTLYFKTSLGLFQISSIDYNNKLLTISHPSFSCLMIDDVQDLGNEFHPKEMKCSHYRRVYKSGTYDQDGNNVKFELGTRISWDIDHVPNPCDECRKPHGNCGVGLRCLCHLTECKVEVSVGAIKRSSGTMLFSLLFLIVLLDHLEGVLM
ncbi:hypothetical protein MTR67_049262 [Solanum verrucosum]|uniref:Uncharacterized protein n=1 Tax=Solanum verrucosum TaxID=315347 RepID=A0AAF0ZX97_SOLVR|nr:hypothetical protein MTR67_049262 [Solanum verrucosum]